MPAIFLSYRRADAGGYAGRLADSLEEFFGRGNIFQDVETIAPGSNFANAIAAAIARCDVLLVLIGKAWLTGHAAAGSARLFDADDFVRQEIATGLRAGTHVIPVLVEGAQMPAANNLPADLQPLAGLQAIELSDTRWDYDVTRLVKVIHTAAGSPATRRRTYMLAATGALVAAIAGIFGYVALSRPAKVAGQWTLPNGSFWIVLQDGEHLTIEETHYDSKQVWMRGGGTVSRNSVNFYLETIYGARRRYVGTLAVAADAQSMSGAMREANSDQDSALALKRAH
jgi:hypothetical protein